MPVAAEVVAHAPAHAPEIVIPAAVVIPRCRPVAKRSRCAPEDGEAYEQTSAWLEYFKRA